MSWNPETYLAFADHRERPIAELIARIPPIDVWRTVDLGCGTGNSTAAIARSFPGAALMGVDNSKEMLDKARKDLPEAEWVEADIAEWQPPHKFDLILSNAALHWVKDHRRLLGNVERSLRPGGRIRFNFAADGNCSHFFKVIREAMALDDFAAYFAQFDWPWYMPTEDAYRALVETAGLGDARVWGENADRCFPDEEAMIRWIDQPSLVPFLVHVAARQKDAFRAFVVRRMIEETKQGDGGCLETFRRINVSASNP